jgi:small subunit ribosomal protein S2
MSNPLVKDLIEAGIHFGQHASNWNPKMKRFIYGKRNAIHIIDIKETIKGLLLAKKFIAKSVAEGKDVCFVGTKRQAQNVLVERVSGVKMHYVTERWLGGTLTNFQTIRSRLKRLEELEQIEQTDNFESYSKKMESRLRREMRKIKRNLEGIRNMNKLPGAMVVIDVRRELNALREARKLGIPTICLVDTDGDTELVDIPIPGNDDSIRAIDVVIRELCAAVTDGKQQRVEKGDSDSGEGGDDRGPRRRSTRSQYRADDAGSGPAADAGGEEEAPTPVTPQSGAPVASGAEQRSE